VVERAKAVAPLLLMAVLAVVLGISLQQGVLATHPIHPHHKVTTEEMLLTPHFTHLAVVVGQAKLEQTEQTHQHNQEMVEMEPHPQLQELQ
jgi:hypothetical protein